MKLHTVVISYNRLELTKQAIESYLETVSVPYTLMVVDNASTDGTQEWLLNAPGFNVILLNENRYPGFATNHGFHHAPATATHLHRADNDFKFLPGWCEHVAEIFANTKVGQVGLRTGPEENFAQWNVGGNMIVRRDLWDQGLRYDERPWPEYSPGYSEDCYLSPAVEAMGFKWKRVLHPCIEPLASGSWTDPYYIRSYGDRGITPNPRDPTLPKPE